MKRDIWYGRIEFERLHKKENTAFTLRIALKDGTKAINELSKAFTGINWHGDGLIKIR